MFTQNQSLPTSQAAWEGYDPLDFYQNRFYVFDFKMFTQIELSER